MRKLVSRIVGRPLRKTDNGRMQNLAREKAWSLVKRAWKVLKRIQGQEDARCDLKRMESARWRYGVLYDEDLCLGRKSVMKSTSRRVRIA